MYKVSAKNIEKIKYCPIKQLLEVQFKGESNTYQYYGVPEDVWYLMRNTASMDIYFNMNIATRYRMRCINNLKKH